MNDVPPKAVTQADIDYEVGQCRAMERRFPISRPDCTGVVVALADQLADAQLSLAQACARVRELEGEREEAVRLLERIPGYLRDETFVTASKAMLALAGEIDALIAKATP